MPDRYEPALFEAKWQQKWRDASLFRTQRVEGRPKFYGLDFFPYPSGAGLSVGHCRNYVPTDVICRMKRMQGFNVLHPMGFDAFGLPAENEAIKRQRHPAEMIAEYTATYRRQMDLVGISYDWSRSFASCDAEYMRWTQWIFQLLYKKGLASRRLAPVNWCPKDKTALANEEVVGGLCERCGTPVEKREIPQWYFRITEYGQRLIDDLETIDWPEGIKLQQRNWIGRSEGVEFSMAVAFMSAEQAEAARSKDAETQETPASLRDPELVELEREVRASSAEPLSKDLRTAQAQVLLNNLKQKIGEAESKLREGFEMFDRASGKIQAASGPINFEKQPHIQVFTTRIDTVFGVTFCVLAPEHPMVEFIRAGVKAPFQGDIDRYREAARSISAHARQDEGREKTGVFTGAYAINPVNNEPVPIWIADYVLMDYGTGAIMAVPAHDQRDFDFATKLNLDVKPVIQPTEAYLREHWKGSEPFTFETALAHYISSPKEYNPVFVSKDSVCINSGFVDGQSYIDATSTLSKWFETQGIGTRKVQFKLRDWLISRQRYWGCPIPVVHTADGAIELVPEADLPVLLPIVDNFEPGENGQSPLARVADWVKTEDSLGRPAMRETDTMGGFADSSWYFLRFCDPENTKEGWSQQAAKAWMPVDCYVGGAEHAVMHLLYARFWTKVLFDAGLTHVKEPFQRLENQGQVLARTPYRKPRKGEILDIGEDGILISFDEARKLPEADFMWRWARMSKSKGNVVTPEEAVEAYGADALRLYLLFVAPFSSDVEWRTEGLAGTARFLSRVVRLIESAKPQFDPDWRAKIANEPETDSSNAIRRLTHQTIGKVSKDIEGFDFNTYVSTLMEFSNGLADRVDSTSVLAHSEAIETLILLLAPGAPHTADELWESLGKTGFTLECQWPTYEAALAVETQLTIAIQVNGKLRGTITVKAGSHEDNVKSDARAFLSVRGHLEGKEVRKEIVVPGRLVNFVVS